MASEKYSIYYMRLLAMILIVNSHFNPLHVINFEPFGLYGYLGSLGNMLFFFISSFVLSLGFRKYESQKIRWIVYRILYLSMIIVTVWAINELITTGTTNPARLAINAFTGIDFISMMLYLSIAFPLLYSISKNIRLATFFISVLLLVIGSNYFDIKVIKALIWTTIFILGITVAKKEIYLHSSN